MKGRCLPLKIRMSNLAALLVGYRPLVAVRVGPRSALYAEPRLQGPGGVVDTHVDNTAVVPGLVYGWWRRRLVGDWGGSGRVVEEETADRLWKCCTTLCITAELTITNNNNNNNNK